MTTVAIAHDHAGRALRATVARVVEDLGFRPLLLSDDSSEPADYPDVAASVASAVATGQARRGIVVCGSGAGISVAANTDPHLRAAVAHDTYTARQMVEHDDINVLSLGARVVGPELAADVVRAFLLASFVGEVRHARRLTKVLEQRRSVHDNALRQLSQVGQSVWLDTISRDLIEDATLAGYIAQFHVTGVTSNPSILHKAIGEGDRYDDRIGELVNDGVDDAEEMAFALALGDLVPAADLLRPTYNAAGGADGYVSIEVSPTLVHDTAGTVEAGRRLFAAAARPNVMIKVPGSGEGLEATEQLLFDGIPVNVTLLFSPDHYRVAADAYLNAMEARIEAGLTAPVASVASMFVSRWDAAVDDRLPVEEQGRLGLALMQETLATHADMLRSSRFASIRRHGGFAQRPLWASTGTKNPSLPETYYLGRLAAPGTVDTVPESTLLAYAEHGAICDLLEPDHDEARRCINAVTAADVDIDTLATDLQRAGVAAFSESWNALLDAIRFRTDLVT